MITLHSPQSNGGSSWTWVKGYVSFGGQMLAQYNGVLTKTDARGVVTTMAYDTVHRLTQKSYSDSTPTATFTYDATSIDGLTIQYAKGRLVKAATSTTRTVQSYDNLGRVKDLWQCTPANCGSGWFQMTYNYNELSAVTSQTNPMGYTLTQTWNSAAVMTALTSSWSDAEHPATLATVNAYHPGGAVTQMTLGNSLIEARIFNNRGQPTEMRTYSTASCTPMPSCQDVMKLTYGFADGQGKNNGNVLAWIGTSKLDAQSQKLDFNRSYTYDQLNRIKTLFSPGETCLGLNWDYDIWGNRLNQNNGGGTCGEHHPTITTLNRISDTGMQYDAAGNLTAEPGKTYQYDAENRMTSIGNGCPNTLCYTYDANARRIRKRISSTITDYIYDASGALVAERQSTNGGSSWTWVKGYVSFGGQMLAQYNGVLGAGGATTYFAHKDHLGSTRLLTTYNGSAHQTFDYLPFGESISPPTPSQSSATTSNQFTGQIRDPESDLDFFGIRFYASSDGRFLSTDLAPPNFENPQSWNRYSYVLNNPLALVDPDGDLSVAVITLEYDMTFEDTIVDPKTGEKKTVRKTIHIKVQMTVVIGNDGSIAQVYASGSATNVAGDDGDLTQGQLKKMGDTAAAVARGALLEFGTGEELASAIAAKETAMGSVGGTRAFNNPLQLAASSGTRSRKGDRDFNISGALRVLAERLKKYDLFKALSRYNAAQDPDGYARKVLAYYQQIRSTMERFEATYNPDESIKAKRRTLP